MLYLKATLLTELETGGVDAVCSALQTAIELEHATIPPYLYALYSIAEGRNVEIADIINSVVIEEMLHMTLACNVLNALGGAPLINSPAFIPNYPGPLPGGVEGGLTVHLAPFSMAQLDTFLSIEQPAHALDFPDQALQNVPAGTVTIGAFYEAILTQIARLDPSDFISPPRHQIGPQMMNNSVIVSDKESAARAIGTIISQGEGTKNSPEEIIGDLPAHYYRFMEIKTGRKLIKRPGDLPPDQQYAYAGDPVPFDPAGVYAVPTDPSLNGCGDTPNATVACRNFNYTYTNLLNSLHAVFNGRAEQMPTAIGLMMSLKGQAKDMMGGLPNGAVVGPSFEYQPTN